MDSITLKYGKSKLSFPFYQKHYEILQPLTISPVSSPKQYLADVIDKPVGCDPLDQLFFREDRILIIVSDITRYTGAEIFLPLLLKRLNMIGICDDQISILFSLGIHRPLTEKERKSIVGHEVAQRVKLFDHNPDDSDQMEYIGETLRGTPISINRKVLKADGLILTGSIAFHYLAGYGGGGKALLPGVSSRETCNAFHKLILASEGYGIRPKSFSGQLEDNPLQEDIMDVVDKLSPNFIINTITNSMDKIFYAVAGDVRIAQKHGCKHLLEHFGIHIREKADLVIASCGGYPKDINFIQAHKSIDHSFQVLREGGVMIALAECAEGFGNATFLNWFHNKNSESFIENLHTRFEINGQTAFSMHMKSKMANIILISSLNDGDVKRMSLIPAANMKKALSISKNLLSENPLTYIIPEGANILPIWKEKIF